MKTEKLSNNRNYSQEKKQDYSKDGSKRSAFLCAIFNHERLNLNIQCGYFYIEDKCLFPQL